LRAIESRAAGSTTWRALGLEGSAYVGAMTLGFFGASPYVLIDWPRFLADMRIVQGTLTNGNGIVVGRGWWYFARVILPATLGWPLFLAGVAGMIVLLRRWRESLVVLAFPMAYYLVVGRGYGVFARYVLPVVPFVCLTAAWLVVEVARRGAQRFAPGREMQATVLLAGLVVAPTAINTVLMDRLLARTDNRVVTARVLVDAIPAGATFHQTGDSAFGMPPFADRRTIQVRNIGYDEAAQAFYPGNPEWVLVQRSPLVMYSPIPPGLEAVLRERYRIVRSFVTGGPAPPGRVYDQQDAFFLPLNKLQGLERPGPSFELYVRR
jgi:hypothetical protein